MRSSDGAHECVHRGRTDLRDRIALEQSMNRNQVRKLLAKHGITFGQCVEAFAAMDDAEGGERRARIVQMAKDEHQEDGAVEVDSNAILSDGEDNGTYVMAWVWVDFAGTSFDKEKEPA